MPSPSNITELIIFVFGALFLIILMMVASRFTRLGRKLTGDWKPGPIDVTPVVRKRENYVDPFGHFKTIQLIAPSLVVLLLLFVFYFLTKNTFQSGN